MTVLGLAGFHERLQGCHASVPPQSLIAHADVVYVFAEQPTQAVLLEVQPIAFQDPSKVRSSPTCNLVAEAIGLHRIALGNNGNHRD
jgi:hypothetical protein